MKKTLTIILALVLALGVLAGCGSSASTPSASEAPATEAPVVTEAPATEAPVTDAPTSPDTGDGAGVIVAAANAVAAVASVAAVVLRKRENA